MYSSGEMDFHGNVSEICLSVWVHNNSQPISIIFSLKGNCKSEVEFEDEEGRGAPVVGELGSNKLSNWSAQAVFSLFYWVKSRGGCGVFFCVSFWLTSLFAWTPPIC